MHTFHVSLKVGEREFLGEGETMQAARHCAATMALNVLRTLPLPTRQPPVDSKSSDNDDEALPGRGMASIVNLINVCLNVHFARVIHSFISGMHHYECVAPNLDINLQSGQF